MKILKTKQIISIIYALIALIIIGVIYIWSPVCDKLLELANGNMVHMRCFYAAQSATYLALLLLTCALINFFTNTDASIITLIIGLMLITITIESIGNLPLGIGVCKNSAMPCVQTALWLKGCGIITIIISILNIFIKK